MSESDNTLREILRKQYFEGALKAVDGQAFSLFKALDSDIQSFETPDNLNIHGSDLYIYISDKTMNNDVSKVNGTT